MKLTNKSVILCLLLLAVLGLAGLAETAIAEEVSSLEPVATESFNEEVTAQDLDVATPTILPDSKFYFLKDWQRSFKLAFTFNQLKKAEVRQEIVNEKLIELQALAKKTQNQAVLEKAAASSEEQIDKLKQQIDKFKDKAGDNPEVNKFLDKFINQGLLQQRVLENLENKVPAQVFEKIEATRERHMEKFGEVMSKLEDKEKIANRINNILENQVGSDFKALNNLKILKKLEGVLPSEAKDSIKQFQEQNLNRFKEGLENMSPAAQERVGDYLEKMKGDKEKKLELLETLKQEVNSTVIQKRLEQAKNKLIEKIEQVPQDKACPLWTAPAPGFCQDGRIVINKDQTGCRLPAKCVYVSDQTSCKPICSKIGTELEGWYNSCTNELINKSECKECKAICGAIGTRSEGWYNSCNDELIKWDNCAKEASKPIMFCITLWDPVCGSDNKTYSNSCVAKNAGVTVIADGECQKQENKPIPASPPLTQTNDERDCETDLDCACGYRKGGQECFYGNRDYVDTSRQCPDYCGGITGRLRLRCVDNTCTQQ